MNVPFLFDTEAKLRKATATGSDIRKILDAAVLKETGAKVLKFLDVLEDLDDTQDVYNNAIIPDEVYAQ